MSNTVKVFLLTIALTSIYSLEPLQENRDPLNKFLQILRKPNLLRRADQAKLKKARDLFDEITKRMKPKEFKQFLREPEGTGLGVVLSGKLVEEELKHSLKQKKSALLDRPIIKSEGKNDYLVMRPDIVDPMVTVIPNAIYMNIEKKCVNWLDDCSLNGIRNRLLSGVRSPYR